MHLEREGGLALLCPRPLRICTKAATIYKRVLDLVLTIPALIALSPVLALCAIAIKMDSPGPVIYRQTRVGKHGVPFEMLKLRSMPVNAEQQTGPIWADPSMPRATRVGRFLRRVSLDEIPQLVNVLRGEMSLVGPRPERPYFVDRFRRALPRYDERLLALPGITGWSQISMSRILASDDVSLKLEGDLFYLEEWSPLLDAQIIVKTAFEFLFQRVA
jgi:lipopolysaccharide/colanic/teichoic acid biosynthesis glycosyltransferase